MQATTDAEEKFPGQHEATEAGVARSGKLEYRFREMADTRERWGLRERLTCRAAASRPPGGPRPPR